MTADNFNLSRGNRTAIRENPYRERFCRYTRRKRQSPKRRVHNRKRRYHTYIENHDSQYGHKSQPKEMGEHGRITSNRGDLSP